MTSALLPLAVTSLLPIVVFPLMDISSTALVCALYFKESNVVFLGGVVLALGVERSTHRFKRHPHSGHKSSMAHARFHASWNASFWISNSGVTAILIPIVEEVVDELFHVTFYLIFKFVI